jgi:hypothetical protein
MEQATLMGNVVQLVLIDRRAGFLVTGPEAVVCNPSTLAIAGTLSSSGRMTSVYQVAGAGIEPTP